MPRMKGAQALARQLRSEGVNTVFTLPGVQIMEAFDALYELRNDIQLVQTRHEQATTYMADGYAKATGQGRRRNGCPLTRRSQCGGRVRNGLCQLVTRASHIRSDPQRYPGQAPGTAHEVEDQLDVFKPITKWNHRVLDVGEIPQVVHEAFRQLKTGRPRPVELEIPPDTLGAVGDADIIELEKYPRAVSDAGDIQRAAQILARSKRPTIVTGGGTITSGASCELRELAEFLQASVTTTQQGKGGFSEDHELAVGANYAAVNAASVVFPDSDATLAVGTRLMFKDYQPESPAPLIQIDVDEAEIGKLMPAEVSIVADAKEALVQLLEQLRATSSPKESRKREIAEYREAYRNDLREMASDQMDMIGVIRDELGDDDILLSGMTNVGYWSNLAYPVRVPRTFITSSYFGTLGYEYPTALGAKVAQPDKKVVALCGDGGFMYNPQELSTASRYGLNVVAVVFNNKAFGASMWDQTHRFASTLHRDRPAQPRLHEVGRRLRGERHQNRSRKTGHIAARSPGRRCTHSPRSRSPQHDAAVSDYSY